MASLYVRVRFNRIGLHSSVPDLILPVDDSLAGAIRDYVTEYLGDDSAFALHLVESGGWIDEGDANAGSFIFDDETTVDPDPVEADEQEPIDPWLFPPVPKRERRAPGLPPDELP